MIVVFTQVAVTDLERIGDYIARDNPVRAQRFVDALINRCEGLAHMPHRFPLVPRYEHSGVRRTVHDGYLVFYRVTTTRVEILHVLHGAQDYEALLFPES